MTFTEVLIYAITFSVTVLAFHICTEPGNIFDWYPVIVHEETEWMNDEVGDKIRRMLCECTVCMSGQLAFWSSILLISASLLHTIIITSFTILFAYLLGKLKTALDIWI